MSIAALRKAFEVQPRSGEKRCSFKVKDGGMFLPWTVYKISLGCASRWRE